MYHNPFSGHQDTIVALATAPGVGAIAVIRVSGADTFSIVSQIFKGKDPHTVKSHTAHFGTIMHQDKIVDEVVVTVFKSPNSFTKEDTIEISCHGSAFIIKEILQLLHAKGCRFARPGEFTQRAFLNGRFDLVQAEAVADLIHAENEAAHHAAIHQMRGGFSADLKAMRAELIHFASLIELELDFGEEDVEFASRQALNDLVALIDQACGKLIDSFKMGNVFKNGVPTVIAGKPNAGKSTLLNTLLNEEKAIVSDIPGTTRDIIEDTMVIDGINFRFIDTAGLRQTDDHVEKIGVQRALDRIKDASLLLYLIDLSQATVTEVDHEISDAMRHGIPFLIIGNKMDKAKDDIIRHIENNESVVLISALNKENIDTLKQRLIAKVNPEHVQPGDTFITNARHHAALLDVRKALAQVLASIDARVTHDILAMDIRYALDALGNVTGEISSEDLLDNIFSKFCIGK